MRGAEELRGAVRDSLSKALKSLLGGSGLRAFRFHIERRLGKDMYEAFYEDPHRFYEAVKSFLGTGADAVICLTFSWLIQNGCLNATELTPEDFVKLLKEGGEEARNTIISSFSGAPNGISSMDEGLLRGHEHESHA